MIENAKLCKLPAVSSLFGEEVLSEDPHQGMNCTIIDEDLFDLTAQPFLNSDFVTAEEFDNLTVEELDEDQEKEQQKKEEQNSDSECSVVKVKEKA